MAKNTIQDPGHNLLVAMSNTPASLTMVEEVARQLPDPARTRITLIHYLQPTMWEHSGDPSRSQQLQDILHAEEQQLENVQSTKALADHYFTQAGALLEEQGVPAANIQAKITWDDTDVADAILNELDSGAYSTVVVGRHHSGILDRLLGDSLADTLRRHAEDTKLWVVDLPGSTAEESMSG
jgi:nucleotide-binding universal stress UspA family protein